MEFELIDFGVGVVAIVAVAFFFRGCGESLKVITLASRTKIKNKAGTSKRKKMNYIDKYRKTTKKLKSKLTCSVYSCTEKGYPGNDLDGSHIYISEKSKYGKKELIIPLCKKHNNHNNKQEMIIKKTKAISVV